MFVSFFPRPKLFFISVLLWTALAMVVWYGYASQFFQEAEKPIGVDTFWTSQALWFDFYFAVCVAIFAPPGRSPSLQMSVERCNRPPHSKSSAVFPSHCGSTGVQCISRDPQIIRGLSLPP